MKQKLFIKHVRCPFMSRILVESAIHKFINSCISISRAHTFSVAPDPFGCLLSLCHTKLTDWQLPLASYLTVTLENGVNLDKAWLSAGSYPSMHCSGRRWACMSLFWKKNNKSHHKQEHVKSTRDSNMECPFNHLVRGGGTGIWVVRFYSLFHTGHHILFAKKPLRWLHCDIHI